MYKIIITVVVLLLIGNLFAQNEYDLVWSLHQKPFHVPEKGSEMAIVKAGFDTDEDGWGEFLCAFTDTDANYILMYEAVANDTFDLVWYWNYPVNSNSFAGIAVGDMDNNGVVEIITTLPSITAPDPNPPRLWVFEWNGVQGENKYGKYAGESFEPTNSWNFDLEDLTDLRPYSLTIEDIDNDGDNELIVGVRMGGRGREVIVASRIGPWVGLGTWNIEYNFQQNFGGSLYSVTTGDLDKDGNGEIYAMIWNNFTLRIFETTGIDQYEIVTAIDELYGGANSIDYGALDGVRVTDINGDGINELYIAGTEPENTLFIITGISDVSQITGEDIKEFYHIPRKAIGKLRTMHVADMDQDGNLSLMIAGEKNGQIYDLEYKGEGDPADSTSWDLTVAFDIFAFSQDSLDSLLDEDNLPRLFYGHPANDMDNDGRNEYVFVNYHTEFEQWKGDGYIWMLEIDNVSSVAGAQYNMPNKTVLHQNYPNPFNPNTTIEYELPQNQLVNIAVYNVLGQKIEVLVNEYQTAGSHTISFNGSHLPSGTYYVKLLVSDSDGTTQFQESKKLILLK